MRTICTLTSHVDTSDDVTHARMRNNCTLTSRGRQKMAAKNDDIEKEGAAVKEATEESEPVSRLNLDLEEFLSDTSRNCSVESPVPEWARSEECCMGIDEAGRGPVLGVSLSLSLCNQPFDTVCSPSPQVQWCMEHVSVQSQKQWS